MSLWLPPLIYPLGSLLSIPRLARCSSWFPEAAHGTSGPVLGSVSPREEVRAEATLPRPLSPRLKPSHFSLRCPFYSRGWKMPEYVLFLFFPLPQPVEKELFAYRPNEDNVN